MSSSSGSEKEVVVLLEAQKEHESSEDPPMSEWSSLIFDNPKENRKRNLYSQGIYSPGSGEICSKYIAMSDSLIFKHVYYNYPAVLDPGIEKALYEPEKKITYDEDGQNLYLAICDDMKTCPVREFHRNLLEETIDLRYYCVNPKGVRAMAMALRYNKYVKTLNLTDNFLNDDASYHLGHMLVDNTGLENLCLSGCRIGPKGMQCLGVFLPHNRTLKSLDLSRNYLGDEGAEHLADAIKRKLHIQQLNLSYNNLGAKSAIFFVDALSYGNRLTHLDLSWNQFYHIPTMVKLLVTLTESDTLEELNLAWNSLSGERIATALGQVVTIPSLITLNLSNNKLCNEAIPLIVANLLKAKKLKTLNLSFNPMTPLDAYTVLQKMLKPRVKIENLFLDDIWISKEFLWLLDRVLQMKTRKNAVITYGGLNNAYTITGPDPRELIMQRADFLGKRDKKRRVDIGLYFLALSKEILKPIGPKELNDRLALDNVPLDADLVNELANVFPGPRTAKTKTINIEAITDFIHRLWPERQLPPTPPPELVPEPVKPDKNLDKKKKGKK